MELLIFGVIVAGAIAMAIARKSEQARQQSLVADALRAGIDLPPHARPATLGSEIEGTVDGLAATFRPVGVDGPGYRRKEVELLIRVELPAALRELGLSVSHRGGSTIPDTPLADALGPRTVVRADEEQDALQVMTQRAVARALHALPVPPERLQIDNGWLSIRLQLPRDPPRGVARQMARAVRTLEAALQRPLRELAGRHGWEVLPQDGGVRARGPLGDARIDLLVGLGPGLDRAGTLVRVSRDDLPHSLRVRRRRDGDERRFPRLGDPILDRMVTYQGKELTLARQLLCHDDVRAPLLEVVHGMEGSWIGARGVALVAPGQCREDLVALVRQAAELAELLAARARALDTPSGH